MNLNQEETLFLKKVIDKAGQAFHHQYPVFTEFLDLNQQNLLITHAKELPPISYQLYGGYTDSERKMACFYPEAFGESLTFPITIMEIKPLHSGYSQPLNHRDFLGALMHQGIERYILGDILLIDQIAYVFCMEHMGRYIQENLLMIKSTSIQIRPIENTEDFHYTPNIVEIKGTVSSLRIDNIVKLSFSLSRGNALELIESDKVYVNSRLCGKSSHLVHEGDIISVRGFGKVRLHTIGHLTKKDRIYVEIHKYQ